MPIAAHLKRMNDGKSTLITLENAPSIKIFEKEVTPPSMSNNGPIDTTTMRNTAVRTQAPKKLKSIGQVTATVAYATDALETIYTQLGVNQPITVTYPDGARYRYWGWLDAFNPSAHVEGEQPTAEAIFQASNTDNDDQEVPPVYHQPDESTSTLA